MATFKAARLSEGNKLFPAEVTINELGVTLKISGLFSGKEQSMSFDEISSVKIDTPMIGYSSIVFDTLGYDRVKATGFSKADVTEMRELIQKAKRRVPLQGNHSGQPVIVHSVESEAVQLARIEQENRKIQAEQLEQERIDAQNEKFMIGVKKYWKIWLPITIAIIILLVFLAKNKDATKASAKTKNFEIEQIEDQVKLAIANKDKEKALLLVNQLVMTEHEVAEGKGTLLKVAYYDTYWDEKREFYKEQILAISDKNDSVKEQKITETPKNTNDNTSQNEVVEENIVTAEETEQNDSISQ